MNRQHRIKCWVQLHLAPDQPLAIERRVVCYDSLDMLAVEPEYSEDLAPSGSPRRLRVIERDCKDSTMLAKAINDNASSSKGYHGRILFIVLLAVRFDVDVDF